MKIIQLSDYRRRKNERPMPPTPPGTRMPVPKPRNLTLAIGRAA